MKKITSLLLAVVFLLTAGPNVIYAQLRTLTEVELRRQGVLHYDTYLYSGQCGADTGLPSGSYAEPGLVYIIGDSITVGATDEYEQRFNGGGWQSYIDAERGRLLRNQTVSDSIALDPDNENRLSSATAIIFALGTNNSGNPETFEGRLTNAISEVEALNPTAEIFWVDVGMNQAVTDGVTPESIGEINQIIYRNAPGSYRTISWYQEVFGAESDPQNPDSGLADSNDYLVGDDIHPSVAGQGALADLVAREVQGRVTEGTGPVIGGSTGANGLVGENNVEMSYNYFRSRGLTAEQSAGIVGNLQAESGPDIDPAIHQLSGGPGRGIAQWEYNGSSTSIRGNWLIDEFAPGLGRAWDRLDVQLDFIWWEFTGEPEFSSENAGSGGHESGAYNDLITQTTVYGATRSFMVRFERPANQSESAIQGRADRAQIVFDEYFLNPVYELGQTGVVGCEGEVSNGAVVIDGYAFPIEGPRAAVTSGYLWPCPSICHHDNTPAFDFAHAQDDSSIGIPVYAITSGTIGNFRTSYRGEEGCNSFQIFGDDGWHYWHGHVQVPDGLSIEDGRRVEAGEQVAIIGERRCTGNGSYPHLHIDRGSPQGRNGGSDCCRDEGFVPLINSLYENLP